MEKMPVLFIGHGSPMNAIEDNEFSNNWKKIGKSIGRPQAILIISAHYYTAETKIIDTDNPVLIYDFFGFPEELYNIRYSAKGSSKWANKVKSLLDEKVLSDNSWGIDHGAWSILVNMFPEADIPIFELSIDKNKSLNEHYELGKKLKSLSDEGVLIIGSGNIVHNLNLIDWNIKDGFDWAYDFDNYIKKSILGNNINNIINYKNAGNCANYAFFTEEHFIPLLYVLGAKKNNDQITTFNEKCTLGSISMTSYLFK